MSPKSILARIKTLYHEYPQQYWVLLLATFVDMLGNTMLYPFLTIYIADKFNVGLTTIAYVVVIQGIIGFIANLFSGNLTDQVGRKKVMIVGLSLSAFTILGIGFAPTLPILALFSIFGAIFGSIGYPAAAAMMADILPEDKRTSGFAVQRIIINMVFVLGPLTGGAIIALASFEWVFILDVMSSGLMVLIVITSVRESYVSKPKDEGKKVEFGLMGMIKGYRPVLRDRMLITFVILAAFTNLVYSQVWQTLAYFMYEIEEMPPVYYSYVLTSNAGLVVLTQYTVSKRLRGLTPLTAMALGSVFMAVGFALFGMVSGLALFVVAMVVVTVGEMIYFPTSQAFVVNLAPADSRGRFMAVFQFGGAVSGMIGIVSAGVFMDSLNPDAFWWVCGALGLITAAAYWRLRDVQVAKQAASAFATDTPDVATMIPAPSGD